MALPTAFFFVGACSLFTSLDGLQGAEADAATDSSFDVAAETAANDSSVANDAGPEASTGILSCNADGLVAYWPMDEGSGISIDDCRQGNDGTFSATGVAWERRGRTPGPISNFRRSAS